jgi:DNA-binding MarR family transcriptional regulator
MKIKKYLDQSPLVAINTAYELIINDVNKHLKIENVNMLQGLVLTALLFEDSEEVQPSTLAKVFQTSRGKMSHIISHLEYQGWVKRKVATKDARQFKVLLQVEGKKKALRLIKRFDKLQSFFEDALGTNQCKKTVENLSALTAQYKSWDYK